MDASQIYLVIAILSFLVIALIFFLMRGKKQTKTTSTLTYLAFIFVIFGIVFGENRYVGYSLMGVGVAIAIVDIILKGKKHK